MAFLQIQFFSKALVVASTVWVVMPETDMGIGVTASAAPKTPPQVLYLLHGYSDDQSIWMRRTSVERYAAGHNLAVVMPAVNHSFYTNEAQGERYWDYVAEELPAAMHSFLRLSDKPEDTCVAGLSMGGYGAMKLALTRPERFRCAGSFSGGINAVSLAERRPSILDRVFGVDKVEGSEHDLFHLLKKNGTAPRKPKLYISCGTDDFLWEDHLLFWPAAQKAGWDVTHREIPGFGHEWALWDQEIKYFIDWAYGTDTKE
ncbi:MAG: esterase family protein [Clostridia bacterium]|nr:esterase family protein [Clostridia bacterium]